MLEHIHAAITREALADCFSPRALEVIVDANVKQDSLAGQFGHDEYHYDNNAFDASHRYINEQRGYVLASLFTPNTFPAWVAFGRLTHSAQDFYAHTNYVTLWLDRYKDSTPPSPPEIDPVDKSLINSPNLRSGKLYYPLEALYFIPSLRKLALAVLPRNSHAHMNLDSEERGPLFAYARAAAVKRTKHEFEILEKLLPSELFSRFVDAQSA
jgi:hypothetical protein